MQKSPAGMRGFLFLLRPHLKPNYIIPMGSDKLNAVLGGLGKIPGAFVAQVSKRSGVLSDLLWLFVACCTFFFSAAYFLPAYAGILISVPISVTIFILLAFTYYTLLKPEMLPSEEHQRFCLEHQYQMKQGERAAITIENETPIENPRISASSRTEGVTQ